MTHSSKRPQDVPSTQMRRSFLQAPGRRFNSRLAPCESDTLAAVTTTADSKPIVSTSRWRLRPREAARQAFGGLTAREREVAVLIAQGKTSREIVGLLVVSERTVEGHVNTILGKLDFTRRSQIAAWVIETGLANR